jgi:hypothetical protein
VSGAGPKEGIYLDSALGAVGERIDERIDRMVTRRRLRVRVLVAVLSVTTVVGGAATAAALTFAAAPDTSATARVEREVSCVEGADPDAEAFFAARLLVAEEDAARLDPAALCDAAGAMLAARPELADANPAQLLAVAAELARSTATPLEIDGERQPAPDVEAVSASFRAPEEQE